MNQITPPPKIEIIPSSAPFSEAQRLVAERVLCRIAVGCADAAVGGAGRGCRHEGAAGDGDDDGEAPWHDQTMPIADRMKLAEGRRCGGA